MTKPISAAEVRALLPKKHGKPSKYHANKTVIDGLKFDSIAEANRWHVLRLMEKQGEIEDLRRQVRFPLKVNGVHVTEYRCDFDYIETKTGHHITEDVKGVRTRDYIIKRNLMMAVYGIEILETGAKPRHPRKSASQWTERKNLKQRQVA